MLNDWFLGWKIKQFLFHILWLSFIKSSSIIVAKLKRILLSLFDWEIHKILPLQDT